MGQLTSGTIDGAKIAEIRQLMGDILKRFEAVKTEIDQTTSTLREDWVGKGATEFQNQYDVLISKVNDIGDSLDEMYQALIDSEAAFVDADQGYHQEMSMSLEDAGLIDGPLSTKDEDGNTYVGVIENG